MYRLNAKERKNKPLHTLLNNGYRFVLVNASGHVLEKARYSYQLAMIIKKYPNTKIIEIVKLLEV